VVVAARHLQPGTTLAADDIRTVSMVADLAPRGAPRTEDEVLGRRTAVGVPVGTPLVPGVVHGDGIRPSVPPGLALAAVRLADPGIARLLQPGDRVTVLAAISDPAGAPSGAETLVERAVVVQIEDGGADPAPSGLLGTSTGGGGGATPLLLLAVSTDEAARLAAGALSLSITAVLVE
jgi:pilus assembly protein CpaB